MGEQIANDLITFTFDLIISFYTLVSETIGYFYYIIQSSSMSPSRYLCVTVCLAHKCS